MTDDYLDTLLDPDVLIEVLSPSTEHHDRSTKLVNYQEIASLQEYVLIAQDTPRVDRFRRQEDGSWRYTTIGLESVVELPSIGCRLALAEISANVSLER